MINPKAAKQKKLVKEGTFFLKNMLYGLFTTIKEASSILIDFYQWWLKLNSTIVMSFYMQLVK